MLVGGTGVSDGVEINVEVGSIVLVGVVMNVEVLVGGSTVMPGTGVRVGMLGTQSTCPA